MCFAKFRNPMNFVIPYGIRYECGFERLTIFQSHPPFLNHPKRNTVRERNEAWERQCRRQPIPSESICYI